MFQHSAGSTGIRAMCIQRSWINKCMQKRCAACRLTGSDGGGKLALAYRPKSLSQAETLAEDVGAKTSGCLSL